MSDRFQRRFDLQKRSHIRSQGRPRTRVEANGPCFVTRESRYSGCLLRRKNATRGADGERKQASLWQHRRQTDALSAYFSPSKKLSTT
jgi:hypothetical protein